MSDLHLLDNILWNTLAGAHARHAEGTVHARRYARGFSPIIGFAEPESPDFAALAPFCDAGEQFYCDRWTGMPPADWRIVHEATMFKMVWDAPMPADDAAPDAVPMQAEHAAQAVALAALTQPGPFGPRTLELGDYFAYFDGERLIAMAGERFCAGALREISGVCTHPHFQGRGMARRLMLKLVRRQMLRGEQPFLHVMQTNTHARALYKRMGFRDYLQTVVRVVSRG